MKGRIKEAAGDLTDDKDLQREGKVDQASGKAKDTIDKASDKVKDALDRDEKPSPRLPPRRNQTKRAALRRPLFFGPGRRTHHGVFWLPVARHTSPASA